MFANVITATEFWTAPGDAAAMAGPLLRGGASSISRPREDRGACRARTGSGSRDPSRARARSTASSAGGTPVV